MTPRAGYDRHGFPRLEPLRARRVHSLAQRIRALQHATGLSDRALADLLGLHASTVQWYRRALRHPSLFPLPALRRLRHLETCYARELNLQPSKRSRRSQPLSPPQPGADCCSGGLPVARTRTVAPSVPFIPALGRTRPGRPIRRRMDGPDA